MTDNETICKLFLELSHVVPEGTMTFREIAMEAEIEQLRKALMPFSVLPNGQKGKSGTYRIFYDDVAAAREAMGPWQDGEL
ncbi:MAG: hypothetical protein JKY32_07720 [Rhizobiales bacterium]|nr:hypothetical protein [Hyphomicrobiales bacterium]